MQIRVTDAAVENLDVYIIGAGHPAGKGKGCQGGSGTLYGITFGLNHKTPIL
jgi:hypothetical protein